MQSSDSKKILIFATRQPGSSVSIHPVLWSQTTRPTDALDLRLDKIAQLRNAIAAGTYRAAAADLAESLIHHMRSNA
jgi:anti-sigma28 factor (negative regulator of flagellin synthesis)